MIIVIGGNNIMKLIDKSALVAEIERRISDNKKDMERASHKFLEDYFEGYEDALVLLKEQFLDTLEVKEVQEEPVSNDLEEAATKYARKQVANPDYPTYNDEYEMVCAFEAGAQWQKEEIIDKACEWLENYFKGVSSGTVYLEDFKKAIKE